MCFVDRLLKQYNCIIYLDLFLSNIFYIVIAFYNRRSEIYLFACYRLIAVNYINIILQQYCKKTKFIY